MAARLSLFLSGRKPERRRTNIFEFVDYDVAGWIVARGGLDVCDLGCVSWGVVDGASGFAAADSRSTHRGIGRRRVCLEMRQALLELHPGPGAVALVAKILCYASIMRAVQLFQFLKNSLNALRECPVLVQAGFYLS